MRIWSKKLIRVLPIAQLRSMRYELGDMIQQYPNIKHSLVKFANDYDCIYLLDYFMNTIVEISRRGMKMDSNYNIKIHAIAKEKCEHRYYPTKNYIFKEDNDRYLKQCYYNLQEKYDRGCIGNEEWQKIEDLCKEMIK
jgi:uncharacterized protein (TIGR02328 family)